MTEVTRPAILPAHIEETVEAIARLHADHHKRATRFQRITEDITALLGHSTIIDWLTVALAGLIAINYMLTLFGLEPLDRPPFPWLESAVSRVLYDRNHTLDPTAGRDELASHR